MHGSSSVPEDLLAIINQYGGKIPETYGVPLKKSKGLRVVSVRLTLTQITVAITAAVREALAQDPKGLTPVTSSSLRSSTCRRFVRIISSSAPLVKVARLSR